MKSALILSLVLFCCFHTQAQNQFILWPQIGLIINSESRVSGEIYLQSRGILNESQFQVASTTGYINFNWKKLNITPGIGSTIAFLPLSDQSDRVAYLHQARLHKTFRYEKVDISNRITYDYLVVNALNIREPNKTILKIHRLRYLLGGSFKLTNNLRLIAIEEIFVLRNDSPFSENRIQIGLSKKLRENHSVAFYYFNRWVQSSSSELNNLYEHALLITCHIHIRTKG